MSRIYGRSDVLTELFKGSDPPLSRSGAAVLRTYLDLLEQWSRRINLTGFRDERAAAEGLLYDAVEIAPLIAKDATVLDVGAGGGGLSVALSALRSDLSFRLVEPRTKRVAFLRALARELDLGSRFEVVQERVEPSSVDQLGPVDVAYAKAVMPPGPWLVLGLMLIRSGGQLLCLTSKTLEELDLQIPPGLVVETESIYQLPFSRTPRVATALRKR